MSTNYFDLTSRELQNLKYQKQDKAFNHDTNKGLALILTIAFVVLGLFTPLAWPLMVLTLNYGLYCFMAARFERDEADDLDWHISYQQGRESVKGRK